MTRGLERRNGSRGWEAKAELGLRRGAVGTLRELRQIPDEAELLCDSQEGPTDQRADPWRAAHRPFRSHCHTLGTLPERWAR